MDLEGTPPLKRRRGPYRKYLYDSQSPVPKTTRWRMNKSAATSSEHSRHRMSTGDGLNDARSNDNGLNDDSELGDSDVGEDNVFGDGDGLGDRGEDNVFGDGDGLGDRDPLGDGDGLDGDNRLGDGDGLSDGDGFGDDNGLSDGDGLSDDSDDELTGEEDDVDCDMFESIYPGSGITIAGAYCATMEFKRICRLPFTTIVVLLQLLQLLCPAGNKLPTTKYQLTKFFRKYKSSHTRRNFCRSCNTEIIGTSAKCSNRACPNREPNSLIYISPDHSLQRIISDNYDRMELRVSKKPVIKTIFNTDGVDPFKSSDIKVYPIYLALWNLPPAVRMLKKNLVTCAFWIGTGKPPANTFLTGLVNLFTRLSSQGIRVKTSAGVKTVLFKPLFGVFDLIAKAPMLNMVQFNGKYGCPSCLHPGKWTNTRVYPPGTDYPLRRVASIDAAAARATELAPIEGIKGHTVLSSIVDFPLAAPVDYMHCVLEGVVKRLLEKWVNSTNHRTPHYIGRDIETIDSDLITQCPHEFSRAPRSIRKHRKFWKAAEFRSWLLYYSLPLVLGLLPALYVHHFSLLVCSMHILLQEKLTITKIAAAEEMLKDFVSFLPELYGESECTINAHLLLHICDHVRQWGPLWAFSAFGFESMNGHLMGHIHATYRMADQLLFSLNISHAIDALQHKLFKSETTKTLNFLSLQPELAKCGKELIPGTYIISAIRKTILTQEECAAFKEVTGRWPTDTATFTKLFHRHTVFHSVEYGRPDGRRDSTVCTFFYGGSKQYGTIQKFCLTESKHLVLIRPFKVNGSLLHTVGVPGRQKLQIYRDCDLLSTFIAQVDKVQQPCIAVELQALMGKCVKTQKKESQEAYIIQIPNYFEYH